MFTEIPKPQVDQSPIIDDVNQLINTVEYIIDEWTYSIYNDITKPTTTYTSIAKPTTAYNEITKPSWS
jgi:hypothetical protein